MRKKIQKSKDNNYAFIDSQNVNLSIQKLGWKLDFRKFRVYLRDKYKVSKAFLFIGFIPENQQLYTSLQQAGYIIVFKPTLQQSGVVKGNCDAELVLHCMLEKDNFNQAVIVTNDGDFYCLAEYLDGQKKLLKLLTPSFKYSSLLRKYAQYIAPIPLFKGKVAEKQKNKKKRSHKKRPQKQNNKRK